MPCRYHTSCVFSNQNCNIKKPILTVMALGVTDRAEGEDEVINLVVMDCECEKPLM